MFLRNIFLWLFLVICLSLNTSLLRESSHVFVGTAHAQTISKDAGATAERNASCGDSFTKTPSANGVWLGIVCTKGVINVWTIVLSLVDLIVVAGLIAAAFANILNLRLDVYGIKQILPGIIIGVILANLSYFIMHFFIEVTTVGTQGLTIIVHRYIGGGTVPQGANGGVSARMLIDFYAELFNSIWHIPVLHPGGTGDVAGNAATTGGGAAIAYKSISELVFKSSEVGILLIVIILLVIFALIPFILMLVLVFLLYIRNYVMIVMFMLSPLAFFALAFPPLKRWWQMWWGTFWKWLLMAPVAYAVLGAAIIFLNTANKDGGGSRNWADYILFNGIAMGLLFWANRIPFTLGPALFGLSNLNVMDKWAKGGRQATQYGFNKAKQGVDKRLAGGVNTKYNNALNQLSKLGTGISRADLIKHIEADPLLSKQWITDDPDPTKRYAKIDRIKDDKVLRAELQQSLINERVNEAKKARRKNILRAPEAAYSGWRQGLKLQDEAEKSAITKHNAYNSNYGPWQAPDAVRAAKEFEDADFVAKNLDSAYDALDLLEPKREALKKAGIKDADLALFFEKHKNDTQAQLQDLWGGSSPEFQKAISREDLMEGMKVYRRLQTLLNPTSMKDIRDNVDAATWGPYPGLLGMQQDPTGAWVKESGKKMDGKLAAMLAMTDEGFKAAREGDYPRKPGSTDPYTRFFGGSGGSGGPSPFGGAGGRVEIAADLIKANKLDTEQMRANDLSPLDVGAASASVIEAAERELHGAGAAARLDPAATQSIVDAVYRDVRQGLINVDANIVARMSPEELIPVKNAMHKLHGQLQKHNDVSKALIDEDAANTAIRLKNARTLIDTHTDLNDLVSRTESAIQDLRAGPINDMNRLRNIHTQLQEVKPGTGIQGLNENSPQEAQNQLKKQAQDAEVILNEFVKNNDVRQAKAALDADPTNAEKKVKYDTTLNLTGEELLMKQAFADRAAQEIDKKVNQLVRESQPPTNVLQDPEIINKTKESLHELSIAIPRFRTMYAQANDPEVIDGQLEQAARKIIAELAAPTLQVPTPGQENRNASSALAYYQDNQATLHDKLVQVLTEGFGSLGKS